mmetsp:Transcript_10616/g.23017  ORF Transcript_10616/g.23017 Transcript_10616/m.23017 type:complete len:201 (-) Transcript_10616:187-789(-)
MLNPFDLVWIERDMPATIFLSATTPEPPLDRTGSPPLLALGGGGPSGPGGSPFPPASDKPPPGLDIASFCCTAGGLRRGGTPAAGKFAGTAAFGGLSVLLTPLRRFGGIVALLQLPLPLPRVLGRPAYVIVELVVVDVVLVGDRVVEVDGSGRRACTGSQTGGCRPPTPRRHSPRPTRRRGRRPHRRRRRPRTRPRWSPG